MYIIAKVLVQGKSYGCEYFIVFHVFSLNINH